MTREQRYKQKRRLTRSASDRYLAGVFGGLGQYFKINPKWLRIGYAVLTILTSIVPGVLIYLLMAVIMIMGKIMMAKAKKAQAAAAAEAPAAPAPAPVPKEPAPGTAGELKLYDTDPRDAAMIMAIVADTLGKPLNELRFKSIREVKDDEI